MNCREGRPAHFSLTLFSADSRLLADLLLPSVCLSVYLLHFHFTATANGAVPISGTVNFNAQRFPYNIIKHNEYAFTCIYSLIIPFYLILKHSHTVIILLVAAENDPLLERRTFLMKCKMSGNSAGVIQTLP